MSNPYTFVLKNGLKVIFIKNITGKSVAIDYRVKAGSNFETKDQIGAAHLIEHLLINKNKEHFTNNGSKIIGITSRNDCLYYIKSLKEHFENTIIGLHKLITTNNISEEELNIEKQIVTQEIKRVLNNPEREIQRRSYIPLYPNTRLEKLNTGELEDITNIKLQNVKKFLNKYYVGKNSILVITGNLDKEYLKNIVTKYLSDIKSGESTKFKELNKTNNSKQTKNIYRLDKNIYQQTHTKINYYGVKITEKDKYILEYLAFILNNYLNQEFRYKKGLAYKLSVENFSSVNYGIFSIYLSSDNNIIYKQILEKIKELYEKINEIDMEVIKNNMVSNFIFDIEKLSKTASFYSENYLFSNEITMEEEIRNIKRVTLKDIKESLKKLLQQTPKIVILK